MANSIKERVLVHLYNFAIWQKARDAIRAEKCRRASILRDIQGGRLDDLELAWVWLEDTGVKWTQTKYYGCTLICFAGFKLCYRPDGRLDRKQSRRDSAGPEQWNLVADVPAITEYGFIQDPGQSLDSLDW